MTVQELIDELQKVKDKTVNVRCTYSYSDYCNCPSCDGGCGSYSDDIYDDKRIYEVKDESDKPKDKHVMLN